MGDLTPIERVAVDNEAFAERRRRAVRVVAGAARDIDDAHRLLDVLGLRDRGLLVDARRAAPRSSLSVRALPR